MPDLKDRIVGHRDVAVADILNNPDNWRVHPTEQKKALTEQMRRIGWIQGVIINEITGRLIDGHLRVIIADEQETSHVPATIIRLSEEEEKLALATYDPLGDMATMDSDQWNQLLADLENVEIEQGGALDALLGKVTDDGLGTLWVGDGGAVPPAGPPEEQEDRPASDRRTVLLRFTEHQFAEYQTNLSLLGAAWTSEGEDEATILRALDQAIIDLQRRSDKTVDRIRQAVVSGQEDE